MMTNTHKFVWNLTYICPPDCGFRTRIATDRDAEQAQIFALTSSAGFKKIHSPRRHRQAVHAVLVDQAGDQTAGGGFSNKGAQKFRAVCVVLVGSDGLLDGGELTVEDARAGEFFDIGQQPRFETGEGFQLLVDEELECTVNALGMHQCGVFDVGEQP